MFIETIDLRCYLVKTLLYFISKELKVLLMKQLNYLPSNFVKTSTDVIKTAIDLFKTSVDLVSEGCSFVKTSIDFNLERCNFVKTPLDLNLERRNFFKTSIDLGRGKAITQLEAPL